MNGFMRWTLSVLSMMRRLPLRASGMISLGHHKLCEQPGQCRRISVLRRTVQVVCCAGRQAVDHSLQPAYLIAGR
jgi:hypothetical protein